jgi:hypothetical protein
MVGRPSMLKYRLHPDKSSPTQLGGASIFHWKENRYLTIAEAAALSGYPPDYEFVGSISSCYAQMGKAVLPPVGAHLAHDALATIKAGKKLKDLKPLEITVGRDSVDKIEIDLTPRKYTAPIPKVVETDEVRKKVQRPQRVGIGLYIRELLTGGVNHTRIVELVRKKFPHSKATGADVAWNKQHMTKPGGKFYGLTFQARKI